MGWALIIHIYKLIVLGLHLSPSLSELGLIIGVAPYKYELYPLKIISSLFNSEGVYSFELLV